MGPRRQWALLLAPDKEETPGPPPSARCSLSSGIMAASVGEERLGLGS